MIKSNLPFYNHPKFGELNKKDLDLYLDYLSRVMSSFDEFEIWQVENSFTKDSLISQNEEIIERFTALLEEKYILQDVIYGN